jgi:hypothetical protein
MSIRKYGELLASIEAFKCLITTLNNSLDKEDGTVVALCRCACEVLKDAEDYIPSFIYIETLKETFLVLVERKIEDATEMISLWSKKSDPQSYARFICLLLSDENASQDGPHNTIWRIVKSKLRLIRSHFVAILTEVYCYLAADIKQRPRRLPVKGISHLVRLGV